MRTRRGYQHTELRIDSPIWMTLRRFSHRDAGRVVTLLAAPMLVPTSFGPTASAIPGTEAVFLRESDALPGGAVFVMRSTAHHQDLRAPSPNDPAELVIVRKKEEALIRQWIQEYEVVQPMVR